MVQAEAVCASHDPRQYLTTATRFEGDNDGHIKAVHTVDVYWYEDETSGRFTFKPVAGTEAVRPAQLVLVTMGFLWYQRRGCWIRCNWKKINGVM